MTPALAHRATLPWVALGGALGAGLRYAVLNGLPPAAEGFPLATLLANGVGAALLGALVTLPLRVLSEGSRWRPLVGAGFCGGLTTFSTLMVEVATRAGPAPTIALGYALASLVLLPLSVLAGAAAVRSTVLR